MAWHRTGKGVAQALCYHRFTALSSLKLIRDKNQILATWEMGRASTMDSRMQKKLRVQLEARKAEIERDVSYMADEMRSIGVEQDDENGSVGNHFAEDGASVAEAERIVTVSEDLQDILAQVNGALARMNDGQYGICQRCG